jgi:hypothetical protein
MSDTVMQDLVVRMAADPLFAEQVRDDPGGALAPYELTGAERAMLAGLGGDVAPGTAPLEARQSKSSLFFAMPHHDPGIAGPHVDASHVQAGDDHAIGIVHHDATQATGGSSGGSAGGNGGSPPGGGTPTTSGPHGLTPTTAGPQHVGQDVPGSYHGGQDSGGTQGGGGSSTNGGGGGGGGEGLSEPPQPAAAPDIVSPTDAPHTMGGIVEPGGGGDATASSVPWSGDTPGGDGRG